MFFKQFSTMSTDEVTALVVASPKAVTAGQPCARLVGKELKLKFTGEFAPTQLDYKFIDDGKLTVTENGTAYDAPYTAVSIGEITLVTHLIPETSRGWHVVYDTKTELVTAFETWFGISVPVGGDLFGMREPTHMRDIPREVQRHYHFGYNDVGQSAPEKLHTTTNRMEGRGLHWKLDCGSEFLTYFPSIVCSTTVMLDEPQDTITVTYPSDYIVINDETYIFAKWGAEFGGEMWLEVLDLFDMKAIGLKFGIDGGDSFTYKFHSASLKVTGDAAHLEGITEYGDKYPPMATLVGKGARYAYRPRDIDPPMTREQVLEAVKNKHIFETSGPNIMASGNTLEMSDSVVGRKFKLTYDHVQTPYAWSSANTPANMIKEFEYDFTSKEYLKWRKPDGEWCEERYVCFEPAKNIYFYSHMLTDDPDFTNVTHAVDFSTGLSTCVYSHVGSWRSEWEIGATCMFGTAAGEGIAPPPFSRRHGFTTDLVGKSYAWTYSDTMSSIHVYSSPDSYSWTIFQDDNSGGATWSSPCFYIKLRDDAYLFQWVEENCNGCQGLVCFNPQLMHDGGFFFAVGEHMGLTLNITGAYARNLGTFNIMPYFDGKANL